MSFTLLNVSFFEGPGAPFILPYDTVSSTSTELLSVSMGLDRVKAQMASALIATLSAGESLAMYFPLLLLIYMQVVHTVCAGYAAKIQM